MYFVHPQIQLSKLKKADLSQRLVFYFPDRQIVFTDMGRSAFKIICEKLNLQGSDLMLPAYICDIFTPILEKYNIRPIFLDIDLKTFHIKREEIRRKITQKTKALLVCHTYGLPFDVESLKKELQGFEQLAIIEDCAHAFGAGVGNRGDVAFFSIYKQFPTLRGGMLVCPKDWQVSLPRTSFNCRDFVSFLNCFPAFAFLFKKCASEIAPKMIRKEKMIEPADLNKKSLALFSRSLDYFEKSLARRQELALLFQEELKKLGFDVQESAGNVFCYLAALVPKDLQEKRDQIVQKLRKYRIFCVRIWKDPIVSDRNNFPNTFEAAQRIINFPLQNYYTEKDIKKMVKALKRVL
jgi:dTDP-4-amino-4,6-dideoxygalactose transaminase